MLVLGVGDPERGKTFHAMREAALMPPALAFVPDLAPSAYPDWQRLSVDAWRDGGQFALERVVLDDDPDAVADLLWEMIDTKTRELGALVLDEFDVLVQAAPDTMMYVARRHRHVITREDGCTWALSQSFVSLERLVSCSTYLRVHQLSGETDIRRAAFHDRPGRRQLEGPGAWPREWHDAPFEDVLRDERLCHGAFVLVKRSGRMLYDPCDCETALR